jgi:quercetin dioxygenase-like cupin family protein
VIAAVNGEASKGGVLVPAMDDELGGDPPCWAHLLEEGDDGQAASGPPVVDLAALARAAAAPGAAWSTQSDDLNVTLVVFATGVGVAGHVNREVDVLIVAIAGDGILEVDGVHRPLRAGQAVIVPKGARRAIRGASDPFAYLTCHRRRAGLWPSPARKPGA